jgi:aminoglycoside phosphotransferase (APT) family kinase protein
MSDSIPTEQTAVQIVRDALGWSDVNVRRFTTGLAFFVYDVWTDQHSAVVRIGRWTQATALADSLALWRRLAPLGVPLPQILVDGTAAEMPFVIVSRLPGTDLGHVIATLPPGKLVTIAHAVADAQLATARLGPGTGFGFAAREDLAPHSSWGDVVAASVNRSVQRITANKLFPPAIAQGVLRSLALHRSALATMPPTPFLHDTTTKNVIVTEAGDFSGIVDVDDLCFGDPRYAVALTKAALLMHGGPVTYVDPWMARMGLADDAVFALYVAVFLLDFMGEHGMAFNGNQAPSDPQMRSRLTLLLAHALTAAA